MTTAETRAKIKHHKICVLIPTYNNHKTLKRVIDGVLNYTDDVLVINDGSTDTTSEILKNYPQIHTISLEKNRGKGNALQIGFKKALELGFHHTITIDSDGQHYPDDIPVFVERLDVFGEDILLIGNRNMSQEGIPGKSSFGNKFSNFWYRFETGISLEDTQSGYRLYPLRKIPKKYFTPKFEFEIEVIVRAAWNGIPVENVPVKVLYDPSERVSHFRPFKDFTRISILNTFLVIISLFYIKPRDFIWNFKKKSFKQFLKEDILETEGSSAKKAWSIALGIFIGLSPLWGFQTVTVIALAVFLRLNKILAFAFSHISFPPLIPFIIALSLGIGGLVLGEKIDFFHESFSLELVKEHLIQYVIGSLILATFTATIFGLGFYFFLSKIKNENLETEVSG